MNVPGNLGIKPLEAIINRNTEWFGKMSPFLQFQFQGQRYSSSPCQSGGTTPYWNDKIFFNRLNSHLLYITLLDYQTMKAHDVIGTAQVNIYDVFIKIEPVVRTFDLYYDGQITAKVRLEFYFEPIISKLSGFGSGTNGVGSVMMSKKSRQNNNQPYYPIQNNSVSQNQNNQWQTPSPPSTQCQNMYPSIEQEVANPFQQLFKGNSGFNNNIDTQIRSEVTKNIIGEVICEQFGSKFKNNLGITDNTNKNNNTSNTNNAPNPIRQCNSNHNVPSNPSGSKNTPTVNTVGGYLNNIKNNNTANNPPIPKKAPTESIAINKQQPIEMKHDSKKNNEGKTRIKIVQETKLPAEIIGNPSIKRQEQVAESLKRTNSFEVISREFTAEEMDDFLK